MITIDFETRSTCDLRKAGAWMYSRHPSTEILCMAYRWEHPKGLFLANLYSYHDSETHIWIPTERFPDGFENQDLEAHNAFFEYCIWNNVGVPKYGFPPVALEAFSCSAAKAAAQSLPRALNKAGEALNLTVQKDESGKLVMLQMCKPRTPTKNNPSVWYDDDARFQKLYAYCIQDVEAEHALSGVLPPLNEIEQKVFELDAKVNLRGVYIDIETVKKVLRLLPEYTLAQNEKVEAITHSELDSTTRISASLHWIASNQYDMANLTKAAVSMALADPDLPENVRQFLKIRQQLSKSSTKKYESLLHITDTDSRARGLLMYHGASTGRWAGKHFQPQNIPRGTIPNVDLAVDVLKHGSLADIFILYGDNFMNLVSSCLRPMIMAAPKHNLFVADYASIEARVLVWLAQDTKGLQLFNKNKDLYIDMAASIYGVDANKVTKQQRSLGKIAILGLGYGMSAKKFTETCDSFGIRIEQSLGDKVVRTYRAKYDLIVSYWRALEGAAKKSIQYETQQDCHHVSFIYKEDNLLCRLPSGRYLVYNQAKVEALQSPWGLRNQITFMNSNPTTRKWERQTTYGGKLCENVCQAVARDILAEALLRCEEGGYPVVLHVHDEIIAEVKQGIGSLAEFINLMCVLPSWASNLPIKAEGWIGKRYKK